MHNDSLIESKTKNPAETNIVKAYVVSPRTTSL